MVLGLTPFTFIHVVISLIGIASGAVVVAGFFAAKRLNGTSAIFLASTALTSLTGFGFAVDHFLPSHGVAIVSLIVLILATYARYARDLAGGWRTTYVAGAVTALYFNVFVLIIQLFLRVPVLKAAAPTQTEPPFLVAQLVALVLFVAIGIISTKSFRNEPAMRLARVTV
jgi:hypothetical protein